MDDVAEGMAVVRSGGFGQAFLQIAAGMAGRMVGDNDAAVLPTLGSQVHDPVGGGDDVEVVLDDDNIGCDHDGGSKVRLASWDEIDLAGRAWTVSRPIVWKNVILYGRALRSSTTCTALMAVIPTVTMCSV